MAVEIYYDFDNKYRLLSTGTRDTKQINLIYEENPTWQLIVRRVTQPNNVLSTIDLSDAVTWAAAVDDDFDSSSEPMVRTLNADIDSSDAANGKINVKLDAETSTFLSSIGTAKQKVAYFELKGYNSSGKIIYFFTFDIIAYNQIDPSGGTPPDPPGNYYTISEVDALLAGKNSIVINTDLTLTDNSTTYLELGAAATYDCFKVTYRLKSSTEKRMGTFDVLVKGTATQDELINYIGDDFSGVTITSEYNSGTPRLAFVVASYGESPILTYQIKEKFEV